MGQIKFNNQVVDIDSSGNFIEACEELDISFRCRHGRCGSCKVEVSEGIELLGPLSENELSRGLNEKERLMCQCNAPDGIVHLVN